MTGSLALSFDSGFEIEKAFQVIQKTANNFFRAASRFQPLDEKTRVGFIVHVNQPCELSKEFMSQYLAKNLYAGKHFGPLSTFEVKLGFQTESDLYKNFAFNIYEIREWRVTPGMKEQIGLMVNVEDIPTTETGISSVMDINNRPRTSADFANASVSFEKTTQDIVEGMMQMLQSDRYKLLPLDSITVKDQA